MLTERGGASILRPLFALLAMFVFATGCTPRPGTRVAAGPSEPAGPASPAKTSRAQTLATIPATRGDRVITITEGGERGVVVGRTFFQRGAPDPMTDVVFRMAPAAKRVLLLGLGTGQLAAELTLRRARVDVIENDPVLAQAVCAHLGCSGNIVVGNATALVTGEETTPALPLLRADANGTSGGSAYDVVIVDEELAPFPVRASAPSTLPAVPFGARTLFARRQRVPTSPPRGDADSELEVSFVGQRTDGTYDVVSFLSHEPAEVHGTMMPIWPRQQMIEVAPGQYGVEKQLRVFGYLVETPGHQLALELPHDRAGAAVVYLRGELARSALTHHAARGAEVVDVRLTDTKADVSMLPLLGVGHRRTPERSVIASGVAVAVSGRGRFLGRGRLPEDPEREGTSYELEVTRVERILDRDTWGPIERRHLARLEAARIHLSRSEVGNAAKELEASTRELRAELSADADHCQWLHATENFASELRQLDERGPLEECRVLASFSPTRATDMRPVPHRADVALYRALKATLDPKLLALARKRKTADAEEAARCWWDSTFRDSTYLTPTQLEIAARFPSVVHAVTE